MKPKLYRVIVPVTDVDAAATFYGRVLGFAGTRVSPGRHYFDCDGTILACFQPDAEGDPPLGPLPDHLYLAVDDVDAVRAAVVAAGGAFPDDDVHGDPAAEIAVRPWGERSFYARDPFGNRLCFVERGTVFTG